MNFKKHGHPVDDNCDLIICWKDNWPESPLPVMALKDCAEKEAKIIRELLGTSISWYEFIEERARRITAEKALSKIKNEIAIEETVDKQQDKCLRADQECEHDSFFLKQILALITVAIIYGFLYLLRIILS